MNKLCGFFGRLLLIAFLCVSSAVVVAQQDKTLFLMHELPQANIVNPAVGIKCKFYIGVPVLSSVHFNYSNTLCTVNEAFGSVAGSDSLKLNLQNIVDQTHKIDLISVEQQLTLLDFGYRWNRNYITFSVRENVNFFGTVPQDMVALAWYGNTHFLGETANLSGLRVNAVHYREFALGFSRDIDEKWRLGIRAKLLFGKSNVNTSDYSGELYTNSTTFAITTSANYHVNASGPVDVYTKPDGTIDRVAQKANFSVMNYLFNASNVGLGVDLGAIYKFNDEITLSASVLDLGAILWSSDVTNGTASGSYSYQGEVNGVGTNSGLADSIRNSYKAVLTHSSYLANLMPRVYVGGTYRFAEHFNTGATFYSEILMNKIHSSLGLSLNTIGFSIFSASLLWSAQNSVYTNIGLGLGAKFGVLHVHILSDNVPAFFALDKTRNVNLRFGINLLFGCSGKNKPDTSRSFSSSQTSPRNTSQKRSLPPAINCPTGGHVNKAKGQTTGYEPQNRCEAPHE